MHGEEEKEPFSGGGGLRTYGGMGEEELGGGGKLPNMLGPTDLACDKRGGSSGPGIGEVGLSDNEEEDDDDEE